MYKLKDEREKSAKLMKPTEGPYPIVEVHINGTVTIQRGSYQERIHIRRIKPYKEK